MHCRIIFLFIALAAPVWLSGCTQAGYYYQAAKGQLEVLQNRQSIARLIDHPKTPLDLRDKLIEADQIRRYAIAQMGLEGNSGFSQYSDIKRQYVTWNVVAAPTFSIEPKTWCFPIAGCVAYKGFFEHDRAVEEQQLLIDQGYDVLLYGVAAYSTLGWFSDPLLNTFIRYPSTDLASLIFHEFAHQVVYIKDDSEFNEAFATAVEYAVLNDWLRSKGETKKISELRSLRARQNRITEMILGFRQELEIAYQQADREGQKILLFKRLKQDYLAIKERGEGTPYYDWWFSRELNNADLLSVSTYFRLVPAFTRLLDRYYGGLNGFFDEIKSLAKGEKTERDRFLESL